MRAARYKTAEDQLAVEEITELTPAAGEILIKIQRVGICGSDLHAVSEPSYPVRNNTILGHEICGTVVALGAGVEQFQVGDRVAPMPFVGCGHCRFCLEGLPHACGSARMDILTGFAEYTLASANETIRIPDQLSSEEGALIEPLAVGLRGVRKAALAIGDRVLVTGAGPIGLAAAFWAQRLGAAEVVMAAHSRRRQAVAEAMGVTQFIALGELDDPVATFADRSGGLPDVVIEAAGSAGSIAQAIQFVKPQGRVVSLGMCWSDDQFSPMAATMKEVSLHFSLCYSKADFEYCAQVMAEGDQRPRAMITSTVSLDQLPEAFAHLRGANSECKVMIAPHGMER